MSGTELVVKDDNKKADGQETTLAGETTKLSEEEDDAANTTTATSSHVAAAGPMTCGEVCTSMWHILKSDEGPDAKRRKLTLKHPVLVALVFSVLGLYDAGTDVWLAATFGSTVLIELDLPNGPNGKCGQYFDPTWSEYEVTGNAGCQWSYGNPCCRYTNKKATVGKCRYFLRDYNASDADCESTDYDEMRIDNTLSSDLLGEVDSFENQDYNIFLEQYMDACDELTDHSVTFNDLKGHKCAAVFLQCGQECFEKDLDALELLGTGVGSLSGLWNSYAELAQCVMIMILAKEGLRLLGWVYFFTAGGINARKTSLFKYIIYSPGTILFYRLPAVQQMIVETTQAIDRGQEAPWLKVVDILMNIVALVLPVKQAQWGGADALTWLSLFGTVVMMIISIILTAVSLAPVLKANASRMTEEELAEARLKQLGIKAALPTSPSVGSSTSSVSKMDRMWHKIEAMEQEIALHKEEIELLKKADERHEARLNSSL